MTAAARQITLRLRRRMLEVAAELAEVAARSPDDAKKEIYKTIQTLRKRYGFSNDVKRAEILRLITLGASAVGDLINETGFDRDDIYTITNELETEGLIVLRSIPPTGDRGGRPTRLFFIKVHKN